MVAFILTYGKEILNHKVSRRWISRVAEVESRACLRDCAISMDLFALGYMVNFQDDKGTLTNIGVVECFVDSALQER